MNDNHIKQYGDTLISNIKLALRANLYIISVCFFVVFFKLFILDLHILLANKSPLIANLTALIVGFICLIASCILLFKYFKYIKEKKTKVFEECEIKLKLPQDIDDKLIAEHLSTYILYVFPILISLALFVSKSFNIFEIILLLFCTCFAFLKLQTLFIFDKTIKYYELYKDNDFIGRILTEEISFSQNPKGEFSINFGQCDSDFKTTLSAVKYQIKGINLSYEGKTYEAIDCLKKAIEIDGPDENLYYNLAECYFKTKQYDKALEFTEKSIMFQQNKDAYYLKIDILLAIENYSALSQTIKTVRQLGYNSIGINKLITGLKSEGFFLENYVEN